MLGPRHEAAHVYQIACPDRWGGLWKGKKGIRKTVVRVCALGRWRCFDSAMVEEVRGSFGLLCRCKTSLVQESKIESYTSFVKSCSRREVLFWGRQR